MVANTVYYTVHTVYGSIIRVTNFSYYYNYKYYKRLR